MEPGFSIAQEVFIGTGSNLGDRRANLQTAMEACMERLGPVKACSAVYVTEAWGVQDQPAFLNQVLQVETSTPPLEVLETLLDIEQAMGRKRVVKWRERIIDIDLLFYGEILLQTPKLTLPHPYIAERNFVLAPLAEIAPDFQHPVHEKTILELYENSPDPLKVHRMQ